MAAAPPTLEVSRPTGIEQVALLAATTVGLVLRWWDLGGPPATYDESFSGVYSHLPLGQIVPALRSDDAHPPLDYLIKHLFGAVGDDFALRVPSTVFASATLLVVLAWMWRRGWFGVAVVALTSLSPFQLLYGHQARMYALAILGGTVIAFATDRWLRQPSARSEMDAGVALLVVLFDVSTALLLAGALMLVPGLRRDREAWRWRLVVAGAVAIWAAVWGTTLLHQSGGHHSDWIPLTSVAALRDSVGQLLTLQSSLVWIAVVVIAIGAVLLVSQDRVLARVWLLLFLVPLVVAVVIGVRVHFLLARTLATSAWAVPVAAAAFIERARQRGSVIGVLAAVLVGVLMLRSVPLALDGDDGSAAAVRAVAADVEPGDAVAVYPDSFWPLVVWNVGAPRQPQGVPDVVTEVTDGTYAYVRPGAPFSGRLWVLALSGYPTPTEGLEPCAEPVPVGSDYSLQCHVVTPEAG